MKRHTLLLSLAVVVFALLHANIASAHAELQSSTPADGASLTTAPSQVVLVFTEELKAEGNAIQVTNAAGTRVDQNDTAVDKRDPDRKTLIVSLKPNLPGGVYSVAWKNNGADGHSEEGSFSFSVATASTTAPAAPPSQLPVTGSAGVDLALPTILALVLVAGGLWMRRRQG